MSQSTKTEIRDLARLKAIAVFKTKGLSSCLYGSAACELYGYTRTPNDVDIIITGPHESTETLKEMLVSDGVGFCTPKTIGATYKILFCKLSGVRCSRKVDILIPGVLNIPLLPDTRLSTIDSIPILPLTVLLILKVRDWSFYAKSNRADVRTKQSHDIRDIDKLLVIGKNKGEDFSEAFGWLPQDFMSHAKKLIVEYVNVMSGR